MSLLRDPKRLLAVLIAGVCGLIVLVDYAGGGGTFAVAAALLVDWAAVITAIALLLGVFSVAASHIGRVRRRSADVEGDDRRGCDRAHVGHSSWPRISESDRTSCLRHHDSRLRTILAGARGSRMAAVPIPTRLAPARMY